MSNGQDNGDDNDDGDSDRPRGERPSEGAARPAAAPLVRTPSIDGANTGPWHDNPDLITWIKQYNRDIFYDLPRDRDSFSVGSNESCDICISDAGVSRSHCLLTRRGNRIEVTDQVTRNGTYLKNSREPTFNVGAGDTWVVAKTTTLLAINDEMHAQRPGFVDILSANQPQTTADDLLVASIGGANILITGEWGCDHDRLARGIHRVSKRRGLPLVLANGLPTTTMAQRKLIDEASRATLLLNLFREPIDDEDPASSLLEEFGQERTPELGTRKSPKKGKSPQTRITPAESSFISMLMSSSFNIRLIVMAPSLSTVAETLGPDAVPSMTHVSLRPLCHRSGEILHLLDRAFADLGSELRVSQLTPHNQLALESYAWPKNLRELRLRAAFLDMKVRKVSFEKAGELLRVNPSTLHYWYTESVDFKMPLLTSREE